MTTIQSNNITPPANTPKKETSLFIFSKNPLVDAAAWGVGTAAAGAGVSLINQTRLFKNKDKFEAAITSLKNEIARENIKPKHLKKFQHELDCLIKKKINLHSVRNWALGLGLITFVPQLIFNVIVYSGKKGYDKLKDSQKK